MRFVGLSVVAMWIAFVVFWRRLFRGRLQPGWGYVFECVVAVLRREVRAAIPIAPHVIRRRLVAAPLGRRLRLQVSVSTGQLGGRPSEIHNPTTLDESGGMLLYLHGGGYSVCSPATHRALIAWLTARTHLTTYALDYRLAPEDPFPAALDDAMAALGELCERAGGAHKVVLAGDSAGGGLALATLLKSRELGLPSPAGALLLSPWVDLACRGETLERRPTVDYLNRDALERFAAHYVGVADPLDPLISPIEASLAGLPPLMVVTGEKEAFRAENDLLVSRARAAGVHVEHLIEPGQIHVYPAFGPMSPGAKEAIKRGGEFLRQRLGLITDGGEADAFYSA